MKFNDYRTIFQVCTLALILLAASPAISQVISLPNSGEQFSELWILGPNHMAENFPYNITVGTKNNFYLGVGNHLGGSTYYLVKAKFRNQTQPLPSINISQPSSLLSIHEFQFIQKDNGIWETQIDFEVLDASITDNSMVINSISINDRVIQVDFESIPDSEDGKYYFQLFFELYLYNSTNSSFEFHDRFVGVWLNIAV